MWTKHTSIIQHHPASSSIIQHPASHYPQWGRERHIRRMRPEVPCLSCALLCTFLRPRPVNLANFRSSRHPSRSNSPPMARKASCQWRSRITHRGRIAWQPLSMSTEEKEYVAYVALVLYSQYSQLRHNGCLRRTQKVLLSIPVNLVDVYGPKFNRMFCRNLPNAKRNIGPRCVQAQI